MPDPTKSRNAPRVLADPFARAARRAAARLLPLAAAAWLCAPAAQAAEYRSVGVGAAVMYDGPSLKGRKAFIAPRGMPVEVLATLGTWVKVRDISGDVLWIERKELSVQRTVIASVPAAVRSAAADTAPILFVAERGVTLDLSELPAPAGWARVRHRDGTIGYARTADVWGLQ